MLLVLEGWPVLPEDDSSLVLMWMVLRMRLRELMGVLLLCMLLDVGSSRRRGSVDAVQGLEKVSYYERDGVVSGCMKHRRSKLLRGKMLWLEGGKWMDGCGRRRDVGMSREWEGGRWEGGVELGGRRRSGREPM